MEKNRIGETRKNNSGSEMIIVEYRNARDIDVYFEKYDYIAKNRQYGEFKKGNIKCPFERRYYGIGYLGSGNYMTSENGNHTKIYDTWNNMLQRCYSKKYQEKEPTYIGCKVCEEWHNLQNFRSWFEENYYEVEGEKMCLDKDILIKHNKIYSPDTCVFVPQTINLLFTKRNNSRGSSVIGTNQKNGKYIARCSIFNPETGKSERKHLGIYATQEKAFEVYKQFKEKNIKEVADYYKNRIPERLYNALYNYEVEITD